MSGAAQGAALASATTAAEGREQEEGEKEGTPHPLSATIQAFSVARMFGDLAEEQAGAWTAADGEGRAFHRC